MTPRFWLHGLFGFAAVLVWLGAAWRTWGASYLGAYVVNDKQMHTRRLVADGPYRLTRNPLYFGNMLISVGVGLYASVPGYAVLVAGMWAVLRAIIRDEEAGLTESQGESYRAYLKAVPRMVPAFRPLVPAGGAQPRWFQGFCGESYLWVLTFASTGLAISLDHAWFERRFLLGALIVLPLFLWARRRRTEPVSDTA